MTCADVGTTNPDISGIGIIIAFVLQAFLSILLSLWSVLYSYILREGALDYDERLKAAAMKKRKILDGILLFASDGQTLNGIALLISGLSQIKSLDLYHLHLLYDTVNFTSISNCAAICCSFKTLKNHRATRFISISLFLVLYVAFVIGFGIRLQGWDETKPGHCYNSNKISTNDAKHPYVDNIYLAITCFVLVGVLEWAFIAAFGLPSFSVPWVKNMPSIRLWLVGFSDFLVLFYAALQFPLHLYSVIVLRKANEPLLQGDSENAWGFGQVVAMVMFGATLIECCRGYKEWYSWVHHSRQPASLDREDAES